ncbi:cupin domain-containing protein [Terrarubrum flagellatum]|uniref:cupin domain-containing protein n=1 Tax=Terrirubrum flagellatum TaxID=2895980 RepID=UPI003144F11D
MSESKAAKSLWTRAETGAIPAMHIKHPWNAKSEVFVTSLAMAAGLSRTALSLGRIPPGKESFAYHSHERCEEFLYILSGKGRAEIDGQFHDVGPGDFMGFTAPGVAHQLANIGDEDLIYLMGGERSDIDVGYFPKLGRRIIFCKSGISAIEDSTITPMSFSDYIAKE